MSNVEISQEEYDSLQREKAAAAKRAEAERKEQEAREAANPPTHGLFLGSGRWVEGNAVATHHSYRDENGNSVVVPVVTRFPL